MAVTRIKNNQITDSSEGNAIVGINAGTKLQNFSITAGKIANNLTYGSDLTISGNLTVNGTTTAVDTVNTLILDPLITLADGQTSGAPTLDIGTIGLRGSQNSAVLAWKESALEFVTALSNTTISNTTFNISSYANLHTGNFIVQGTTSLVGNIIGAVNATDTITGGNLATAGTASAGGNITGGNLLTGGLVSATATITGGNLATGGTVSATATITGGNLATGGTISGTGNLTAGNILSGGQGSFTGNVTAANFIGNISGNVDAGGANTNIQFNDSDILAGSAAFTFDKTSNAITASGNITAGNVLTGGLVSVAGGVTAASVAGGVITGSSVSATANVTGGNVLTGGQVSATANVTGGNVLTGGLISATGNITGGNIDTAGTLTAASFSTAGNITGGNLLTGGLVSVTGGVTASSVAGGVITGTSTSVTGTQTAASTVGGVITGSSNSVTGNVTGGNVLTGGQVSATANVTGGNLVSATVTNPTALTVSTNSGNINLEPAGNVVLNDKYINGLQLTPVQDSDAASKYYVDTIATTGITIHEAVFAATVSNLDTATGGTVTYAQPNGAANGIGATLTTTGTYTTIDTANVANVGTRILVKDQGNAVQNGVYVYSNATVITRSVDTDQYGADSAESFSINDYFFTTNGNINAGTAFVVSAPPGVITFGTSNISFGVFSQATVYSANTSAGLSLIGSVFSAKVDNNTTAFDGLGNISVKAGANLTTPNIGVATGTSLSVTGTVTAASTVGGVITGSSTSVTGTQTAASTVGGVITGSSVSVTGAVTAASTVGGVITGSSSSVTGNVDGGNINTGGQVSATATITGGNLATGGTASATGNITGGNILSGGLGSFTGNVTAANFIGNISGNVDAAGANTQVQFNDGDILGASAEFTFDKTANLLTVTGNVASGNVTTGGQVSATANVTGGNVLTGGQVSATANVTGGNVLTGGLISATATITGGNLATGGTASATGNVTGGNVLTGGLVSATSNITSAANVIGGNITTAGVVSATANITGGNITTVGVLQGGNIVISGDDITDTNGRVNFNTAGADVDFAVNGDTLANVFYVDAGTGTASFGSSTQVTNAIVNFATTTSFKTPVGNTAQRPAVGVTGMQRFNTTNNSLEIYNNSAWQSVGSTVFTVIADEQFNGDGSTLAFTLGSTQTTNSCIVSINGVIQIPTLAYAVAGTNPTCVLTFTEAPASGDVIDVRQITTTTTVTSISNDSGNAVVAASDTAAQVNVTGDLSVSGSILGGNINSTAITNGTSNMTVVSSGGNIRGNVGGTTVMTISAGLVDIVGNLTVSGNATLSGNILGDRIQNGTTSIDIQTASGNANINIGGTGNLAVFSPDALNMTGNIIPTANVTYNLGSTTQRWNDLWLANSTIYLGNSQISANATSLILTNPQGGQTVLTGTTANITAATVSTTGNITGSYILGNGSQLTGIDATSIQSGTSNVKVVSSGGNVTTSVGGTNNVVVVATTGQFVTGIVSVTGNIDTGGNINITGAITANGMFNNGSMSSTGNIFAANVDIPASGSLFVGNIVNVNANSVGNIGSAAKPFNTVFAKATSAQYADLAEKYTADADYAPGTVVSFGGTKEVTITTVASDTRIAGVVSTNPSYRMNDGLVSEHTAMVALTGRVPTSVTGTVRKGDMMVAAGNGVAHACVAPAVGTVIGKALADSEGDAVIEIVVGRV